MYNISFETFLRVVFGCPRMQWSMGIFVTVIKLSCVYLSYVQLSVHHFVSEIGRIFIKISIKKKYLILSPY